MVDTDDSKQRLITIDDTHSSPILIALIVIVIVVTWFSMVRDRVMVTYTCPYVTEFPDLTCRSDFGDHSQKGRSIDL